ncbi:hypothetical protein P7C70_g7072, partial [Phenoliferia sp. Uapishka_3]
MMTHPAVGEHLHVSYAENNKVLVLRLNRPKSLNAMTMELESDLCRVLDWFENEPTLWAVVVTGTGRVFCAGQDLKEALERQKTSGETFQDRIRANPHGFASLARRISRKPIIVALNGSAYGGGAELLVNCDIVIGCKGAEIAFPEVRRGLVASVGGIPNLMNRSPVMAAYLLAGLPIPQHFLEAHVLTEVCESSQVMPTALKWAKALVECSPDAVRITKAQINKWRGGKGVHEVVRESTEEDGHLYAGENVLEGLKAFGERRLPKWADPERPKAKL